MRCCNGFLTGNCALLWRVPPVAATGSELQLCSSCAGTACAAGDSALCTARCQCCSRNCAALTRPQWGKFSYLIFFWSRKGHSEQLCILHLGSNADHLANFIMFQGVEMPPVQKLLCSLICQLSPCFISLFFLQYIIFEVG